VIRDGASQYGNSDDPLRVRNSKRNRLEDQAASRAAGQRGKLLLEIAAVHELFTNARRRGHQNPDVRGSIALTLAGSVERSSHCTARSVPSQTTQKAIVMSVVRTKARPLGQRAPTNSRSVARFRVPTQVMPNSTHSKHTERRAVGTDGCTGEWAPCYAVGDDTDNRPGLPVGTRGQQDHRQHRACPRGPHD
jgi:hypothetical protein